MAKPLTATIFILSMLIVAVMAYWLSKSRNESMELRLVAGYCLAELFLYFTVRRCG